jgi:predicted amidohydrolase
MRLVAALAVLALAAAVRASESTPSSAPMAYASHANSIPRKVVVGSVVANFDGSVDERLRFACALLDSAGADAQKQYGRAQLDLMVFPEFAIRQRDGTTAAEQSVSLAPLIVDTLGAKARQYHTWVVLPMVLREENGRFSNAAILFDRAGRVAGIFRKVHPIADEKGVFEGGVTPGEEYPVFDCDFGKLGILICWDMSYDEAWDALATKGAEIVAVPSASPQTLRPMAQALRHHYYVVNSTPRDNVSLYDPVGQTVERQTRAPGVLVHEIDLSFAILHWSESLHEGKAFTEKFGDRVGYLYSSREDTGLFWSNDARRTIGSMVRELGLHEMPEVIAQMDAARRAALAAKEIPAR